MAQSWHQERREQCCRAFFFSSATEHASLLVILRVVLQSALEKQLKASKRKGNDNERWWLQELWSGRLRKEMQRAEGKCHRVQANDFVVNDDD